MTKDTRPDHGDGTGPARSPYAGAIAVLATMHGKEAAIAGPLLQGLGLRLETAGGIDTDSLGTFTGEVPRAGAIEEAAVAKARLGMQATGLRIGIASEGSYGPHPQIPFVAAGIEVMVLVDDIRGIVIRERILDENPVFDQAVGTCVGDVQALLRRIDFPTQAVIVRASAGSPQGTILKGIRTGEALADAIARCSQHSRDGRALVQTDMRAHMNPARMEVLRRLSERLALRAANACPQCEVPGFGVTGVERGLPCKWCLGPSTQVRYEILECASCDHVERRPRPDGLAHADPAQCPTCNP